MKYIYITLALVIVIGFILLRPKTYECKAEVSREVFYTVEKEGFSQAPYIQYVYYKSKTPCDEGARIR